MCPIIRSLSVPNGPTAGGTVVTINGDNFGLPTSLKSILIGETPCSEIESLSTKQVSCTVPPGTGYDLPVTVRINELEGQSDSNHGGATWSYDGPQVRKVEPNHASGKGGALIALRGLNFGAYESHPMCTWVGSPAQCSGTRKCRKTETTENRRTAGFKRIRFVVELDFLVFGGSFREVWGRCLK